MKNPIIHELDGKLNIDDVFNFIKSHETDLYRHIMSYKDNYDVKFIGSSSSGLQGVRMDNLLIFTINRSGIGWGGYVEIDYIDKVSFNRDDIIKAIIGNIKKHYKGDFSISYNHGSYREKLK